MSLRPLPSPDGGGNERGVGSSPLRNDRRATLVTFTQRGEQTAKALERDHIEFASKLFSELPETTFRGYARGLDAVLARLRELLAT